MCARFTGHSLLPITASLNLAGKMREAVCLKHIGIYAFRKNFLQRFCEHGPVPLELAESLEQLRALYLGARIRVVEVDHESLSVEVPEDVPKLEAILKGRG